MKRDEMEHGFECVEPELGAQIWRLQHPDDPDDPGPGGPDQLRPRLREHVRICDACRLRLAFGREIASGLASGSLRLPVGSRPLPPRRAARLLAWSGATAAAAGLALLLALPPLPVDGGRVERAGGRSPFLRPVEGEVLADLTPALSWRPVAGASRYEVTLRQIGGGYRWRTSTEATSTEIPAALALPRAADLRATVEPVPADLAAPGELTVGFRTGTFADALLHRLWASGPWTRAAGALALLLLAASLAVGRAGRRAAA